MKLKDQLLFHLKNHMHKLIDDNDFGLLEDTANLSNALQTGKLEQLPYDEQIFWLNKVDGIYRYFIRDGNPNYCNNSDIKKILEIIGSELKSLKKKL